MFPSTSKPSIYEKNALVKKKMKERGFKPVFYPTKGDCLNHLAYIVALDFNTEKKFFLALILLVQLSV